MTRSEPLTQVQWRMSSFCGGSGAGAVYFTRPEMAVWIKGVKSGEFDDLT